MKQITMLLILIGVCYGQIVPDSPIVPYIDTEGNFRMNYTGECVNGIPNVAFTCAEDSLNMDSLMLIYPTLVTIETREAFDLFIETRREE